MKSTIIIFFLIALSITLPAQERSDVISEGLKGNVKSIITRGYSAETVNGQTKKSFPIATTIKEFNDRGLLTQTISGTGRDTVPVKGTTVRGARLVYHYDHLDNLVSSCSYYPNGNINDSSIHEVDKMGNRTFWKIFKGGGTLVWEYIKEYDNVGNLLETNDYHYGRLETRHTYRFDDNSHCIKESDYDENGKLKWEETLKYDANGHKTEVLDFNTIDGTEVRHYFKYSDMGKPIEEDEYGAENSTKFKRTLNFYDEAGNIIEIKQYSENGVQIYEGRFDRYGNHLADIAYNEDGSLHDKITAEYRYDTKGNEIEEALHYTDGTGATSISKYQYDAMNNWVKKTVFEEGEATRLIEREITYY
jgi:hypothetical protein